MEIERAAKRIRVHVFTARPGIIIGKKGADIEALKKELTKLTGKDVYINFAAPEFIHVRSNAPSWMRSSSRRAWRSSSNAASPSGGP